MEYLIIGLPLIAIIILIIVAILNPEDTAEDLEEENEE